MKKYNSLDLTKLIMAIAVVAIHTDPFGNCPPSFFISLFDATVLLAVPFFFLTTGFLLGIKTSVAFPISNDSEVIRKYIAKTVRLYLLWNIIYLPLAVYGYYIWDIPLSRAVVIYFRDLLGPGDHYNSWMLWYLLSTIYALSFIYFLTTRKVPYKIIFTICVSIGLLGSIICDWLVLDTTTLASPWDLATMLVENTIKNGRILRGLVYIPLGMHLAHHPICLRNAIVYFIAGFLFLFWAPEVLSVVCLAVCALGLFSIVVRIDLKDSKIYGLFRSLSTTLYFTHMWIFSLYYYFRYGQKTNGFDSFLITVVIGILLGLGKYFLNSHITRKHLAAKS